MIIVKHDREVKPLTKNQLIVWGRGLGKTWLGFVTFMESMGYDVSFEDEYEEIENEDISNDPPQR